ncbi:MAG: hypothetical protein J2P41_17235 [Blastocatellia bacterium]|nr:hypothetical protein [Blastocatellia bacterium]
MGSIPTIPIIFYQSNFSLFQPALFLISLQYEDEINAQPDCYRFAVIGSGPVFDSLGCVNRLFIKPETESLCHDHLPHHSIAAQQYLDLHLPFDAVAARLLGIRSSRHTVNFRRDESILHRFLRLRSR